jgi:LuxR family maltose regulon positive regulatory protein
VAKAWVLRERGHLHESLRHLALAEADESTDDLVIAVPYYRLLAQVWLDDVAAARASAARTRSLRPLGVVYDEVLVGGSLSWGECVTGELRAAERLADTALATAAEHELVAHPALIEPLRTRGRLLFERGNLDAAEAALERSLTIAEKRRPAQALLSAVALARVWISQGRLADAAEAAVTARRFLPSDGASPLLGYVDAVDARLALVSGDLVRAEELMALLEPSPRQARLVARLRLNHGAPELALTALDEQPPRSPRGRVDDLLLRARCAHDLHAPDAPAVLSAAIDAARPEHYAFAVAEDLYPMAGRVSALLRERPLDHFATAVLTLRDTIVEPVPGAPELVEALTDRELTVLRYLDTRMTHAEIASELFVSVNTVKTHNKAIHRKLAVGSRQEAVAEARRRNIR